ncbi:hypothetical protein HG530_008990 [Fusarium avenaceum]|nr:hypothetical protein HG530_008990 [Fusarium avenaceum]
MKPPSKDMFAQCVRQYATTNVKDFSNMRRPRFKFVVDEEKRKRYFRINNVLSMSPINNSGYDGSTIGRLLFPILGLCGGTLDAKFQSEQLQSSLGGILDANEKLALIVAINGKRWCYQDEDLGLYACWLV